MRARLTINLKPARTSLLALVLTCSSLTSLSIAQEIDFQKSIDSASKVLAGLNLKASDCLATLDSNENSQIVCDDFMKAIDGELVTNYLDQCRSLKDWRDKYVNQTMKSDMDLTTENNAEMLKRLVSIEFTCGENALSNRTQFVFSAFNRLRSGAAGSEVNTAIISRKISNSRFNALENGERQRLQNSLQSQRIRSLRESERQFNDLKNELILQQIQNSNLPN